MIPKRTLEFEVEGNHPSMCLLDVMAGRAYSPADVEDMEVLETYGLSWSDGCGTDIGRFEDLPLYIVPIGWYDVDTDHTCHLSFYQHQIYVPLRNGCVSHLHPVVVLRPASFENITGLAEHVLLSSYETTRFLREELDLELDLEELTASEVYVVDRETWNPGLIMVRRWRSEGGQQYLPVDPARFITSSDQLLRLGDLPRDCRIGDSVVILPRKEGFEYCWLDPWGTIRGTCMDPMYVEGNFHEWTCGKQADGVGHVRLRGDRVQINLFKDRLEPCLEKSIDEDVVYVVDGDVDMQEYVLDPEKHLSSVRRSAQHIRQQTWTLALNLNGLSNTAEYNRGLVQRLAEKIGYEGKPYSLSDISPIEGWVRIEPAFLHALQKHAAAAATAD